MNVNVTLLVFNEELLISASHQLTFTFLHFEHTDLCSYQFNDLVKCSNRDNVKYLFPATLREIYRILSFRGRKSRNNIFVSKLKNKRHVSVQILHLLLSPKVEYIIADWIVTSSMGKCEASLGMHMLMVLLWGLGCACNGDMTTAVIILFLFVVVRLLLGNYYPQPCSKLGYWLWLTELSQQTRHELERNIDSRISHFYCLNWTIPLVKENRRGSHPFLSSPPPPHPTPWL